MKQIILEGPDGSGKSTLLGRLIDHPVVGPLINNNMPSFSVMQEMDTPFEQYIDLCMREDAGPLPPRIYDRFFFSELVYGPILRGKIDYPPAKLRKVRLDLGDNAFLIYCRLPYEVLVERATERPQKDGVLTNLHRIYKDYETIMGDNIPLYWIRNAYAMYDQTDASFDVLIKLLVEYLNG